MSGRNRRVPASVAEVRRIAADVDRVVSQVRTDYAWLHKSGYVQDRVPAGDPAGLMYGSPAHIRHLVKRASERLDETYAAAVAARVFLVKVAQIIDEHAAIDGDEGIDPDMPTASASEVRFAQKAQARRAIRARRALLNGDPFPDSEVSGS